MVSAQSTAINSSTAAAKKDDFLNTYTRLKGLGIEPVVMQERILSQEEMK